MIQYKVGFPSGSTVKNPPAMQEPQEMWVRSLGQEDPLEEGMATHSSILAWRIPWTEEPGRLQSIGSQRADHHWSDLACTHSLYKVLLCLMPRTAAAPTLVVIKAVLWWIMCLSLIVQKWEIQNPNFKFCSSLMQCFSNIASFKLLSSSWCLVTLP